MCPLHQSHPSFYYIWIEIYHCYVCPFCEFTWFFSCAGWTVAFTRWNTLQSGKVDLSPLSQLQRSLSSGKFTHGTGWRMKISTSGPEHASLWRKLSRKSSRGTSDHAVIHTRRIPYILLLRNVRYCLFCSRQKLCSCAMLWLQPRVAYHLVVVCERHLNNFCNICVDVNLLRRDSRYVFMFIIITMVSSFVAPVCCFKCVYDVLKHGKCSSSDMVSESHRHCSFGSFASSFSWLTSPASMVGWSCSHNLCCGLCTLHFFQLVSHTLHTTQYVSLNRVELLWKYMRCRVITNTMAYFSTANMADSVQTTRQIQHN